MRGFRWWWCSKCLQESVILIEVVKRTASLLSGCCSRPCAGNPVPDASAQHEPAQRAPRHTGPAGLVPLGRRVYLRVLGRSSKGCLPDGPPESGQVHLDGTVEPVTAPQLLRGVAALAGAVLVGQLGATADWVPLCALSRHGSAAYDQGHRSAPSRAGGLPALGQWPSLPRVPALYLPARALPVVGKAIEHGALPLGEALILKPSINLIETSELFYLKQRRGHGTYLAAQFNWRDLMGLCKPFQLRTALYKVKRIQASWASALGRLYTRKRFTKVSATFKVPWCAWASGSIKLYSSSQHPDQMLLHVQAALVDILRVSLRPCYVIQRSTSIPWIQRCSHNAPSQLSSKKDPGKASGMHTTKVTARTFWREAMFFSGPKLRRTPLSKFCPIFHLFQCFSSTHKCQWTGKKWWKKWHF